MRNFNIAKLKLLENDREMDVCACSSNLGIIYVLAEVTFDFGQARTAAIRSPVDVKKGCGL